MKLASAQPVSPRPVRAPTKFQRKRSLQSTPPSSPADCGSAQSLQGLGPRSEGATPVDGPGIKSRRHAIGAGRLREGCDTITNNSQHNTGSHITTQNIARHTPAHDPREQRFAVALYTYTLRWEPLWGSIHSHSRRVHAQTCMRAPAPAPPTPVGSTRLARVRVSRLAPCAPLRRCGLLVTLEV